MKRFDFDIVWIIITVDTSHVKDIFLLFAYWAEKCLALGWGGDGLPLKDLHLYNRNNLSKLIIIAWRIKFFNLKLILKCFSWEFISTFCTFRKKLGIWPQKANEKSATSSWPEKALSAIWVEDLKLSGWYCLTLIWWWYICFNSLR